MKGAVKTLALLSIFSVFTLSSLAQLKLSLVNPIAGDLRRVLDDYSNNFKNLVGEMIDQSGQSTVFNCKFTMAGAEETTVTQYSSKNQNIRSWQALMLTTESFDKAKQKFKSLYGQINHLDVSPSDGNFRLKGEWEQPQE